MPLEVIGAGVGRTGTYSLKLAISRLGLGPCHHMEDVLHDMPAHVPLWQAAVDGQPDWEAVYQGYQSAVDWPTASFYRELIAAYPSAKFILTHRSPDSWLRSFSETIYKVIAGKDQAPPQMRDWLAMAIKVIAKAGFRSGLDQAALRQAFIAHNEAVKAVIPAKQLLVYEVKDGWEPLCAFLGVPVPSERFPETNKLEEFWERISGKK